MTAVLWRSATTLTEALAIAAPPQYAIPVLIFVLGWVCVMLDMPIYMAFEGRRFWPGAIWHIGLRRERKRLARIHRAMRRHDMVRLENAGRRSDTRNADRLYLENAVRMCGFPLDPATLNPMAAWPTKLGNLVAEFEQYPGLKYGLDSVFFWPRLWVSVDKDLREEIDSQQAQADGLLYLTAALTVAAAVMLAYAVVDWRWPGGLLYRQSPGVDIAAAMICLGAAAGIYRASLYLQRQFGDTFKAVFDQHRALLKVDEVVDLAANLSNDPGLRRQIENVRNRAAWRLLRWHRVRLRGSTVNRKVRLP
jgi:hypothetical protein